LPDLRFKLIVRANNITTRINYGKVLARPLGIAIVPVARNARHVVHNSLPLLYQPVKKGGFAYVGSAYYCNNICHLPVGSKKDAQR